MLPDTNTGDVMEIGLMSLAEMRGDTPVAAPVSDRTVPALDLSRLPADAREKAAHLLARLPADLRIEPKHHTILVLQYVRGDTTKGGIILPGQAQREDEFQGRVGLVLALAPDAYDDGRRFPAGPLCQVGDWVVWKPMASAATRMRFGDQSKGAVIAWLNDDAVIGRVADPNDVIGG